MVVQTHSGSHLDDNWKSRRPRLTGKLLFSQATFLDLENGDRKLAVSEYAVLKGSALPDVQIGRRSSPNKLFVLWQS